MAYFDINKRRELSDITVKELISELPKMPQDAKVTCCGDTSIYLHVTEDANGVCIDYDDLRESSYIS